MTRQASGSIAWGSAGQGIVRPSSVRSETKSERREMNKARATWMVQPVRVMACNALMALVLGSMAVAAAAPSGSPEGGRTVATRRGSDFRLENGRMGAKWSATAGKLNGLTVWARLPATEIHWPEPFAILLKDGTIYNAGDLKLAGEPVRRELVPRVGRSRLADTLRGASFEFPLESSDGNLRVLWSMVLLDGTSYLRRCSRSARMRATSPSAK